MTGGKCAENEEGHKEIPPKEGENGVMELWSDGTPNSLFHYSITPPVHCPISFAGPQGAIQQIMNNVGHLPLSETAARRVGPTKARRGRPRKNNTTENVVREPAAVGTLTRTKSLLLAALRVWELKHRISD